MEHQTSESNDCDLPAFISKSPPRLLMQCGRNSNELKPKKLFCELGLGHIVKISNVSKDSFLKHNEAAVAFDSDYSSHGEEQKI